MSLHTKPEHVLPAVSHTFTQSFVCLSGLGLCKISYRVRIIFRKNLPRCDFDWFGVKNLQVQLWLINRHINHYQQNAINNQDFILLPMFPTGIDSLKSSGHLWRRTLPPYNHSTFKPQFKTWTTSFTHKGKERLCFVKKNVCVLCL